MEVVYDNVILVLKGLSLSAARGGITALLGANGAGKTTTLKAMSGLLQTEDGKVTDGDILYQGRSIRNLPPEKIVQQGIFQVMEGRRVFEDLTVEENLRCGAFTRPKNRFADNLDKVYTYFPRLKDRSRQLAGYMSGGEQQMLAIGRALMARPRLLVLDEPSMGLAPKIVDMIFQVILDLKNQGSTILLVEQNARAALEIADRGYVLETGTVVLQGSADELLVDEDVKRAYLGRDYGDFYEGRG
jgi:branched-chain amino acid transport system ATP-binding protein